MIRAEKSIIKEVGRSVRYKQLRRLGMSRSDIESRLVEEGFDEPPITTVDAELSRIFDTEGSFAAMQELIRRRCK